VGGGAWLGGQLAVPLSQAHRTVNLAERIAGEDAGRIQQPDNASKAFRATGASVQTLTDQAVAKRAQFRFGGMLLGAFVGLVLGVKLLGLSFDTPHTVYEPDRANCVACGRCYAYCPKELVRVKREASKTS
jgi:NosR/NirI family transcriptional regulator, nitrous oxide reductase regulator